jgi:hypothetical protein
MIFPNITFPSFFSSTHYLGSEKNGVMFFLCFTMLCFLLSFEKSAFFVQKETENSWRILDFLFVPSTVGYRWSRSLSPVPEANARGQGEILLVKWQGGVSEKATGKRPPWTVEKEKFAYTIQ